MAPTRCQVYSLTMGIAAIAFGFALSVRAGTLDHPYIDPSNVTAVPFGARSQWIQPWRGYLETIPASTFVRAVGVNYGAFRTDKGENPELIVQMLARHGISNARIEISWGSFNYDDETKPNDPKVFQDALRRMVRYGIRPTILLNSHHGVPCPCRLFRRKVTAEAKKGDTALRLDNVDGLVIGHSGLSHLTESVAAEAIITGIDGNVVTLSKPLPKDISAGTLQDMATLKYQPFGPPDAAETAVTMAGWQRYVLSVAKLAADALCTANAEDKGFDLEIWNELTFGHYFLSINRYYEKPIANYDWELICPRIVGATAEIIGKNPQFFSGVSVCDGFSNTTPWPAASKEPAQVNALSHHPYPSPLTFPAQARSGDCYDALMRVEREHALFEPTYAAWFPEYSATLLQTEHCIRDMAPIVTDIFGTRHGRWARGREGSGAPFETWLTETGMSPDEAGIRDRKEALEIKAKSAARTFCFFINKGVTKLEIYGACAGDLSLGVVSDHFIDYSKSHDAYPHDDADFVSPMLRVMGRIVEKMRQGIDPKLQMTQAIAVDSISDAHDHVQFRGDGTAAHPDLFNRDVLAILPFQVNTHRWVIPYYVMTRDLRQPLTPEEYTVQLSGIRGIDAKVEIYDPVKDVSVPATVNGKTANTLNLTLKAADYPYLLCIDVAN